MADEPFDPNVFDSGAFDTETLWIYASRVCLDDVAVNFAQLADVSVEVC